MVTDTFDFLWYWDYLHITKDAAEELSKMIKKQL